MTSVEADSPEAFALWLADPGAAPHGGESLAQVLLRVKDWLDRSAALPANRLVVASPFIVRVIVVAALGLPPSVFWRLDAAPLGVTRLTAQNGRWRLAAFNAAS